MSLSVNIEKRLDGFRLRVEFEASGGLLSLLGASGSGKSLTLRCIAGLLTPDRGRIVLNRRTLFDSDAGIDLPPQRRRVGYLFQSCALIPHMTVLENVALGLRALPRRERRAAALVQLERFRLAPFADARPATLSGGERQRAALARTLAAEPEALLLDEPFSALDDSLKWELELELARTLEGYGGDVVLVTHSRDEVCRLAKTVCVLDRGRSEPVQTVERLMTAPGTVSAAQISGCKNLSPVTVLPDGSLSCAAWGWTIPAAAFSAGPIPAGLTHVGLRARSLHPEHGPTREGSITLACAVDRVIDNVFSYIVLLRTPGPGLLRMELPKEEKPRVAGTPITVHVSPEELLLLTNGE